MPLVPQTNDYAVCSVCCHPFTHDERKPVTLSCSHTLCSSCIKSSRVCPFDQSSINEGLPVNEAILCAVSGPVDQVSRRHSEPTYGIEPFEVSDYHKAIECLKCLASLLRPNPNSCLLSRPMQRKVTTLLHSQLVESEGRLRALRSARSIGERALTELLIKHQNPHSLSTSLWAAVRSRGCQFLGPAMQEEVLKLVLLALEDGISLSRKVLVMFVVQRLSEHFPHQSSKTAIGHVVQILYRGSCFKLTKREGDSSLMQLKEEFCSYESLRREHDTQIVSIAIEAGLRISPDQWSSLLYGDTGHKSHMQSIIDKLQTPHSFTQSILELMVTVQRTPDPGNLFSLKPHLERLAQISPGSSSNDSSGEDLSPSIHETLSCLESTKEITFRLVQFLHQFSVNQQHNHQRNPHFGPHRITSNINNQHKPRGVTTTIH